MEITTLVPVLLPIVLFIITLIIILVMREQDNHKRGVASVRKLTDQLKADITAQQEEFKSIILELEDRVSQKDGQIQAMFQEIDNKLKEVETYSEDLGRMRASMETYREALGGLAKLTQDADTKISQVEEDVEKLENVRKEIDGFKLDMKDADEHLKQHEGLVIQMERDAMSRLEDRCKSLSEDFSFKIDRLCDQLDIKIEATRDATESLMNEGAEVLGNIGDRTAEQVQLSSQVRELYRQKERLLNDINTLNRKAVEKAAQIEPISDGPVDEPEFDEPVLEEPVFDEPVVVEEEPVAEEPAVEEQVVEEPVAEEPVVEAPVAEEPEIEDVPFEEPMDVEIEEEKEEFDGEEEEIVFD